MNMKKTKQLKLLDELIKYLSDNEMIHSVIVRGSISKGLSDKYSDIDLLLITKNEYFGDFIQNVYDLINKKVPILTESGWIDTNVPNFGGIGYVFLVEYENEIIQLDLYTLPEENAKRIWEFEDKIVIQTQDSINFKTNIDLENNRFTEIISNIELGHSPDFQDFFDILLHFEMLSKYLCRKNVYLSCKYWHLLHSKMLKIIRKYLDRKTADFMFYDVERHLSSYESSFLEKFETHLKEFKGFFDFDSFLNLYEQFTDMCKTIYPDIYNDNKKLLKDLRSYIVKIYENS